MIKVEESILLACHAREDFNFSWKIIIDTSLVGSVDSSFLERFSKYDLKFMKGKKGDMGHGLINQVLDEITSGWIYILDDDNEMHPELIDVLHPLAIENPLLKGFIFSQQVSGRDFTGLDVREAKPENVKVQKIDMGQFIVTKSLIDDLRFVPMTYTADGIFIEKLYEMYPNKFMFVDKILCNYNSLSEDNSGYFLPRVAIFGTEKKEVKTSKLLPYESDELKTFFPENDEEISKLDPDCIISVGESYEKFPSLLKLSPDYRLRWIHVEDENRIGDISYDCSMHYILKTSLENEMVSIFTPVHKTGRRILRTYSSLASQTYNNWEWVIVNDSDDPETIEILESLKDSRIKIYDFKHKSGGNIGEAKYRACSMSKGAYLVELDHDDYLLPHALEKVIEAFRKHKDAGFVYTDCAEVSESFESMMYGETFAFGYGSYRKEIHLNREFQIAATPNINPVTIRHIVSVPNHLRAWRRDVYHMIGGHNRRLRIADDYDLIVRTFLKTKMVKIPMGCYLQFYHGENSQNAARADIQRRVRTISNFYNEKIKQRFEELGKEDWAYGQNFRNLPKRDLDTENFVNYIYE